MPIDQDISKAIATAVANEEQPDGVARKLTRWFDAIATGNEQITDKQSTHRHLELIYGEVDAGLPSRLDELLNTPVGNSEMDEDHPE
jgi:hypothetical protein